MVSSTAVLSKQIYNSILMLNIPGGPVFTVTHSLHYRGDLLIVVLTVSQGAERYF